MPDVLPLRHVDVDGLRVAYRECGDGPPVLMLHGNPTSSYLWRHVQPRLADHHRVVAPDLMGMGGSQQLADAGPGSYRFADHRRWLARLMEELGVTQRVVLVGHDWGGALAFDWARRHPDAVRGIAYTETIVRPRRWADEDEGGRRLFEALRSDAGERLVLTENLFIEKVLPGGMLTDLAATDHDVYREPFLEPGESRRAMLTWPREIPFDGQPADVTDDVAAYAAWLSTSPVPKLFVRAVPGAILTGDVAEFCRALPNQREVVVAASHFVPEDAPDALADALVDWLATLS